MWTFLHSLLSSKLSPDGEDIRFPWFCFSPLPAWFYQSTSFSDSLLFLNLSTTCSCVTRVSRSSIWSHLIQLFSLWHPWTVKASGTPCSPRYEWLHVFSRAVPGFHTHFKLLLRERWWPMELTSWADRVNILLLSNLLHPLLSKLACHALADAPSFVSSVCSQCSWSLVPPRLLFIDVGVIFVALVTSRPHHGLCKSCWLLAGLSTILAFPYLRKSYWVLSSVTPLWIWPRVLRALWKLTTSNIHGYDYMTWYTSDITRIFEKYCTLWEVTKSVNFYSSEIGTEKKDCWF